VYALEGERECSFSSVRLAIEGIREGSANRIQDTAHG
jgi:hypothetical protein